MMDRELTEAFKDVKISIETGHARLEGKLDLSNAQFNKHLIDDTRQFTLLQEGQKSIESKIVEVERKRKEDSDRRQRAIVIKEEEERTEQNRRDQWKWVKWAGGFAIIAAMVGSTCASALTYWEHRQDRIQRTGNP